MPTPCLSAEGSNGSVIEWQNQPFDFSRDERWIAFTTDATNYSGVTDTNQSPDVYVRGLDPDAATCALEGVHGGPA